MKNEQLAMSNGKRKCIDCLNCKVSKTPIKNRMVCFCIENNSEEKHVENYWRKKTVCSKFIDMIDNLKITRRPLIKIQPLAKRNVCA